MYTYFTICSCAWMQAGSRQGWLSLHILDIHQQATAITGSTSVQLAGLTAVGVSIQHSFLNATTLMELTSTQLSQVELSKVDLK